LLRALEQSRCHHAIYIRPMFSAAGPASIRLHAVPN
jgi:hypothetical protein